MVYERYENYPTVSVSVTASDGTVARKRSGFQGATFETKYRIRFDFIDRPITEDSIHKEFSLGLLFHRVRDTNQRITVAKVEREC